MSKKLVLVLAMVLFFSRALYAHAGIRINEFVSDPDSGSEWIELYNDSSTSVDLSGWSWTELASPGGETEHEGTPKNLSGTISAAGVFVFEMTSALNNTGDSIGLYDGGSLVDRVTFGKVSGYSKDLEAPAKGASGALISGSWQTNQAPTKGAANSSSGAPDNNGDNEDNTDDQNDNEGSSSGSSSSTSSSSYSKTSTTAPAKIKTEVSVRNIAYVGIPLAFQGKVMQGGQQVYRGRYFWNFGDGDFREVKVINTDKFTHTYFYSGDYTVSFEYYSDSFAETPEASQNINIKVIDPAISISRAGDINDFFVELSNNTNYEVNISGWLILGNAKSFTIPKNTLVAGHKKIIIPGQTSGLTVLDLPMLKLALPDGKIAFEYRSYTPARAKAAPKAPAGASAEKSREEAKIPANNLGAGVAYADNRGEDGAVVTFSSFVWPAVFVGFTGLAASAVYFIRRRKTAPLPGSDFELLDE